MRSYGTLQKLGEAKGRSQACSDHENRGLPPHVSTVLCEELGNTGGGRLVARAREKQLSQVVSELGLDKQNKGDDRSHCSTTEASRTLRRGPTDGMSIQIRIPEDELTYSPSITVMPHAGELEIEFFNDDTNTHCAQVPSNGDYQWIWLPNGSRGKVNVTLDGPGYYWYGSNVGNDEGRGLMGAIVCWGTFRKRLNLDRPPQPRP